MTQVTEALRSECAAEWQHLLNETFSSPMAVEHLAQFVLSHRKQAVQEAVAGIETRFWSIVDPNSVPSDMWGALDRMASAYRTRQEAVAERDARIVELREALEGLLTGLGLLPIGEGDTCQTITLGTPTMAQMNRALAALQEIDNDG